MGLRTSLVSLGEHFRSLVDQVPGDDEVAELAVAVLDDCFDELKRVEGAGAALKARLVACASAARAHKQAGMTDTGAYLRDRLGVSGREAKRQAELSEYLSTMEDAADALADGRLGIEQAGVLGRAARDGRLGDGDEVERQLLDAATSSSPEDLRRNVRKREQAADTDALRRDENKAYALRRASISKQPSGMWSLHAELDPVDGELVSTAIRAFMTLDDKGTPPEQCRSTEKRTADGLVEVASRALNAGTTTKGGVRPHISVMVMAEQHGYGTAPQAGSPMASQASRPMASQASRPMASQGGASADGCGCPAGSGGLVRRGPHSPGITGSGTVLSPEATSRLVCDSALSRIVMTASSQVLDVGQTTRAWTGPQRRAVIGRDGGCRGPGCDRPPDWCDVHHIWWWRRGGPTDLHNGILLCRFHHRMVHEGGWGLSMDRDTGRAVFTDPRGKEHVTLPRGAPTLLG